MPFINGRVRIKIWRDSRKIPKEDSDIIVVLDDYVFKGVEVTHFIDGKFTFRGFYGLKWSDYAWKILKWCYLEDVLNLE